MRTELLSIDYDFKSKEKYEALKNIFYYQNYKYFKSDIEIDKYYKSLQKSMLNLINLVMREELTDNQRQAVILCKIKGIKQKEAAKILKVDKSVISRQLKSSQKIFNRAIKYFLCNQTRIYD